MFVTIERASGFHRGPFSARLPAERALFELKRFRPGLKWEVVPIKDLMGYERAAVLLDRGLKIPRELGLQRASQ